MLCFRIQPADDASASWTKPNAIWPWGRQDARRKYRRAHGSLPTVQFTFSTPRYGSPSCSYSGAITIVVLCLYCILPDFTSGAIFAVYSLVLKGDNHIYFVLACDLNLIVIIELGCRRSIAFLLTCLRSCKFAVPERKIDITKKVSLEHFNDLTTETCYCCKNDIKFIGSDACIYSQLIKKKWFCM